jgi:hypothetical protein
LIQTVEQTNETKRASTVNKTIDGDFRDEKRQMPELFCNDDEDMPEYSIDEDEEMAELVSLGEQVKLNRVELMESFNDLELKMEDVVREQQNILANVKVYQTEKSVIETNISD